MLPRSSILRIRQKSLLRGILLSLGGFIAGLRLAGFPYFKNLHGSHWEIVALLAVLLGMVETGRCLGRRWSLYHAGVLLLLCSDLMILAVLAALLALS